VPASRLKRAVQIATAASLLLVSTSSAFANPGSGDVPTLPPLPPPGASTGAMQTDGTDSWFRGGVSNGSDLLQSLKAHHDGTTQHLPPVQENIDLVSRLEMNTPPEFRFDPDTGEPDPNQPPVMPEQIADVAVYKNFAYLNSWEDASCRRGGIFVVDITNPAQPQQVAFLPAQPNTRHGEGAHVITIDTPTGPMDVLGVNNEVMQCNSQAPHAGGFNLWNVTDPRNPVPLAMGIGDTGPDDGNLVGAEPVHQSHSTFMWTDDRKRSFVVFTDNQEELHDVDIFEITDPRNPRPVAEHALTTLFPQVVDQSAYGDWIYNHDIVVKKIDGTYTMLVSFWDGGYVKLDVDEPAAPEYIADSHYDDPDPLARDPQGQPWDPPEGNAHQAEFSHDNRYILAADEDFDTHRLISDIGGDQVFFPWGEPVEPDGTPIPELQIQPGEPFEGDTRFVGDACTVASIAPPQGEETIAIAERGGVGPGGAACTFELKTENAQAAGYEGLVIFNNVLGAAPRCETVLNMTWTTPEGDIKAIFVPRVIGFYMMGAYDEATYRCVANDPTSTPTPAPNRAGLPLELALLFDGWGYTHLFRNGTGKLQPLDHFAVPEGLDERYWSGFGTLSVHEFAADPTENIAYSAYYAAGMRVFSFGEDGLTERGAYIAPEGNNFWGVEQFTSGGERYFAGSDRDYGLYIFRYTGPGAAARPTCADQNVVVPYGTAVTLTLQCSDANGNRLTRAIGTGPSNGSLGAVDQGAGTVTYTPRAGYSGPDSFTFTANDGAATSAPATMRIVVGPNPRGCRNEINGTGGRDMLAGTAVSDRIRAGAGKDVIDARSGADCLFGQAHGDNMDGEGGNDQMAGGGARDIMTGGRGADRMTGAGGMDRMFGNQGNDRLTGGKKRDYLAGGHKNDRLIGGGGRDSLVGDKGNDRMSGGSDQDILRGNQGSDRITGGRGRDLIVAGQGPDRVNVRDGREDHVSCGSGRDRAVADRFDRLTNCERISR
jgi:hypothetical protein